MRAISACSPFRRLKAEERIRLAAGFRAGTFAAGDRVVSQDRRIRQVGLIESGAAELRIECPDGGRKVIGSAERGDFFGMTSLLKDAVSPFSIVCTRSMECWLLQTEDFLLMLEAYPIVREHFFLKAMAQMAEALQALNGVGSRKAGTVKVRTPRQRKLETAMRYIDRNFVKSICLEDVAARVGMSKFHFSRIFKSETGRSFKEHVTRRRIEAAKALMLRGETVTTAAKKNGFHNPSYFTRVFRRVQGMTPTDYLKMVE